MNLLNFIDIYMLYKYHFSVINCNIYVYLLLFHLIFQKLSKSLPIFISQILYWYSTSWKLWLLDFLCEKGGSNVYHSKSLLSIFENKPLSTLIFSYFLKIAIRLIYCANKECCCLDIFFSYLFFLRSRKTATDQ